MKMARFTFFMALLLALACQRRPHPPTRAFYYWQTTFRLSPAERSCLDSLSCKKCYVKVLDVSRDPLTGNIEPLSRLDVADTTGLAGRTIVPVVFITNEVFQHLPEEKTTWLAESIGKLAQDIGQKMGAVGELQVDCDWTGSTRVAYFSFLQKLKTRLPPGVQLSATIRLHQYKFPEKTGVPPTDRGMLMLYNTGNIEDWSAGNSIFNPADAEKYVQGAPAYPLPLDVALPVFSWGLVYREEALWKIISGLQASDMAADTARFLVLPSLPGKEGSERGCMRFAVRRGTFQEGHYLRPGDLVRCEAISPEALTAAAALASHLHLADDATVALFALDTATVRAYPAQLLQSVWKK